MSNMVSSWFRVLERRTKSTSTPAPDAEHRLAAQRPAVLAADRLSLSGIIATSDGVVVLDALNSQEVARAQREAIASTIRQPVRILASSTFHNNYSKGNVAYADVLKIGHENYRTDLLEL